MHTCAALVLSHPWTWDVFKLSHLSSSHIPRLKGFKSLKKRKDISVGLHCHSHNAAVFLLCLFFLFWCFVAQPKWLTVFLSRLWVSHFWNLFKENIMDWTWCLIWFVWIRYLFFWNINIVVSQDFLNNMNFYKSTWLTEAVKNPVGHLISHYL